MTDVQQGNSTEVRTASGEMIDQTPKVETKTDTTSSEKSQDPPKQETKAEPDLSKKDDPSKLVDDKSKSLLADDKEKKEEFKGPPEKYEFKLPEGVILKEESLTEVSAVFKELGVPQEQAQKLMDFHVKALQEATDSPMKAVEDNITAWRKEVSEDAKLGPRLGEIKQSYSRMLDAMNDPAAQASFREAVEFTGVGNHPAFIRMMDKISSHFSEGKPLQGGKPAPVAEPGKATGTGPKALYPNNP